MSIDLTKLTPAPWNVGGKIYPNQRREATESDYDFIDLARAAFDVMLKRGWSPVLVIEGGTEWRVVSRRELPTRLINLRWPDPFTALVAADEWHREHIEKPSAAE